MTQGSTLELCFEPPGSEVFFHDPNFAALLSTDHLPEYAHAKEQAIAAFDRHYLKRLLAQSGGNVTHAARIAGKERRALGKLIKRYKLSFAD